MVNKKITGVIALISLSIIIYYIIQNNDQARIKKQFHTLANLLEKKERESLPKTIIKTNNFRDLFTTTCTIDLSEQFINGAHNRAELASLVFNYRLNCKTLNLSTYDQKIELTEQLAYVTFTARLNILDSSGQHDQSTKEIMATLQKQDNKWLFSSFEEVTVLEK